MIKTDIMKTCIICRQEKNDFNDEHVIPDSIKGYYHITSVCTTCNSDLGTKIDLYVTNHHYIEMERFIHSVRGKSGNIPNPLRGNSFLVNDPDQKVSIEVVNGKFSTRLLPKVPNLKDGTFSGHFTVAGDKRDEKKLEQIVNKMLDRKKIDRSKVTFSKSVKPIKNTVSTPFKIDLHRFKAGLLKIAYEFAVDKIPEYFQDAQAITISKILLNADFENLSKDVVFYGNGFDKRILIPFEGFINFENNNHYLVLHSNSDGLFCLINIFTAFSIMIKLSERTDYLPGDLLIGKNDLKKREFIVYTNAEMVETIYSPQEYRFEYYIQDQIKYQEFQRLESSGEKWVLMENDRTPIFDKDGSVMYEDVIDKIVNLEATIDDSEDCLRSLFNFDEEMFVKSHFSNELFQVVGLAIERYRHSKL
jgi:hypothetical protein